MAERAREAGKLDRKWRIPEAARANRPERLSRALSNARFPRDGEPAFTRFPFGSDFTPVEERLIAGLARLESLSGSRRALAGALMRGRPQRYPEELRRMGLEAPMGFRERAEARVLAAALAESGA